LPELFAKSRFWTNAWQ